MDKLKAILHIDELEKWRLILANTRNLIEDVGLDHLVLEIVVNAAAVQIFSFADQDVKALLKQMEQLSKQDVTIAVCRNALKANSICESSLPAFITVVPAGISRIIMKQTEGYSYVKP
jgi:intracellular sulfur oxidation DsrE/DsrF family protein